MVIMDGNSGYIGISSVYLKYLDDGYIQIRGKNETNEPRWKLLCEFGLNAGVYTITGLFVPEDDTVQLRVAKVDGATVTTLAWQYNSDERFVLNESTIVRLHIVVYPGADIDTIARPAIYKEISDE